MRGDGPPRELTPLADTLHFPPGPGSMKSGTWRPGHCHSGTRKFCCSRKQTVHRRLSTSYWQRHRSVAAWPCPVTLSCVDRSRPHTARPHARRLNAVSLKAIDILVIANAMGWICLLAHIRDRDRGKPHSSAPPTPPDMRVRIRRFGGLSDRFHSQSWNPERVEVSIGQCDAERRRVRQPPRTMIAARRLSGQVGVHIPTA